MKILGLDSSGMVASVAVVQDEITIAEYTVNYKKTHSETLLPMLDEIMNMTKQDISEMDAIAVAAGPGSFTGLRIGSATAKGLAMAIDKPIVAVPTCAALAYNMWGNDNIVCPILDARRNQVYTGIYRFQDDKLLTIMEQEALDIEVLIEKLNSLGDKVFFVGDGIPVFEETINAKMTVDFSYAPAHLNRQRAAAVAALGVEMYKAGDIQTADEHSPIYLRKSQAEREREEKMTRGAQKHE